MTGKGGQFSIFVEEGDSIDIRYVGMLTKTVAVNSKDSVHWNIGLQEYGPIIEPALQHSYSTYDGVSMSVQNLKDLAIPVESIVLSVKNDTDETVTFGEVYELFQMRDGQWLPMPYNRDYEEGEIEQVFPLVGYTYAPHSENTNVNNTTKHSEKFEKGFYRMTNAFVVGQSLRRYSIYVEFSIV